MDITGWTDKLIFNLKTLLSTLNLNIRQDSVADPDIKMGGRGREGGHPDPEIRGMPSLKNKNFSALRASVWSKNKGTGGGGGSPGFLP